jgi:hypothetical protein
MKKMICWVKWEDICKPKVDGGLGIRVLRLMNLRLLVKWRWKLLYDGNEVWKKVIVVKYGGHASGNTRLETSLGGQLCSSCWKDLCRLDEGVGWFNLVVRKKLVCGNSIKFWKNIWVGDQTLEQLFPRLFSMSAQQDEVVRDMGVRWMVYGGGS